MQVRFSDIFLKDEDDNNNEEEEEAKDNKGKGFASLRRSHSLSAWRARRIMSRRPEGPQGPLNF